MYYSKSNSSNLIPPRNYSGNTFRVIDESDRKYIKEQPEENEDKYKDNLTNNKTVEAKKDAKSSILPSIFSDISVEDVLLLGLMLVIHQENPNDTTLLLLLILLLAK